MAAYNSFVSDLNGYNDNTLVVLTQISNEYCMNILSQYNGEANVSMPELVKYYITIQEVSFMGKRLVIFT